MTFEFFQGDIACMPTAAIAIGSDESLGWGQQPSDLMLAAGPLLMQGTQEVIARQGKIATGSSVLMSSGELPCQWVIYVAVPGSDDVCADDFLAACYRSCLRQAQRTPGLDTLAFQALAMAPDGDFDMQRAADIAARACKSYMQQTNGQLRVIFCSDQSAQLQCLQQAFAADI